MSELTFYVGQAFNGLSLASILLLAALGLALSFGLMRVINMAHGEMLMLGGYAAFLAQSWLPGGLSLPLALVLAFVVTALLGALLEATIVRHLYGRPLDTLLATWGVSLVLQQAVRNLFGPLGVEFITPSWLRGAFRVSEGALTGLALPYVRIFVIALAIAVLATVLLLLRRTRLGMYVRAVNQNREMAAALGVNTRRLDMTVFALGAGVAGLAGAALAMIAPVTPTVGLSYIVDAFLVVILGGIGSIVGAVMAALSLGFLSAFAESFTSVSFAKVLLLVFTVAFLQVRPSGFMVTRSRALEEG